ncbi:hypothetical protein [Marinimicrobium agarilyticum]|uniref:hypothetical protein n=1 Tax=Marinimicrobium agarilyticum TaxID=306546 RepID=UPI0003FAC866|nr:hypothetical protein [Marinimicrobium agarilyticum]
MNEYQRQAYLDALGVEQYVPRWLLSVAPEPFACELPAEVAREPRAERPAPEKAVTAPAAAPTPVSEVLDGMRQEPSRRRTAEKPTSEPASAAPEPVERVRPFTLSIWRSPLPVLVLDAREPRSAFPTDRLLRNLLNALGPHDGQRVTEEVLPWPLVNNPAVKLTAEDARAELHTWLEAELSNGSVRHILLMGENAARYFLPEGQSYSEVLGQVQDLPRFNVSALVAPSLIELLRDPTRKRPLWQSLQPWLPMTS